jgi:hypothetical protein
MVSLSWSAQALKPVYAGRTCLFTILAVRQFHAGGKLSVNILAACMVLSAVKYALPMMA